MPGKSKDPRKHHYVPQFYVKKFGDIDGRLWMYDRKVQRYAHVHPKTICWEKDLYTIDPEGTCNAYVENVWFDMIDTDGSRAIRRFENGIAPDVEWRSKLSLFMAQQLMRSPEARKLATDARRAEWDVKHSFRRRNPQLLQDELDRLDTTMGAPPRGVTAESLIADIDSGRLKVSITEWPFIEQLFRQCKFMAEFIFSFEWELLIAPSESGFIVGDYPFILVPAQGSPDEYGFGFPGATKYFPITRGLCLRMGRPGRSGFGSRGASKYEVRIINQNTAVNSERFIMGRDRDQLEYVVCRSKTDKVDAVPRTTVRIIPENETSTVIGMSFWPFRRYFYL